ncbi:MAG: phytoene desaturase family protein [Spirochaetia bacterium]
MKKSVIVIGAGVAGLSAGCYAAMNGFQTRIYEMHTSPGGLCTAWRRGGYTVDGCIHWLVGSKPGTPMYGVWEELGAVQGRTFFYAEEFQRFEGSDGRVFTFSTNLERLEQHMREVAPQDGEPISRFCNAVREFTGTNLPVSRPTSDMMRPFLKWNRMPMTEILAEFKSPLIRKAICHAWPECFPAGFLLATLAWLNDKAAGYPIGGSLDFSRALERRYLGLGGELSYKSRVSRILVEADSAVGVQLEDGSEHQADFVISAADGHATIFDWLRGRYVDRTIQGYYENLTPFPSLVLVALGVNRKFEDVPVLLSSLHIELAEPLRVADCTLRSLSIRVFNNDSTLAPPERTTVLCSFVSDESWWKDLRRDPSGYCRVKKETASKVIAALDRRFPSFASQVEMTDVATPLTFERYTGNWKGSIEGWMATPRTGMGQLRNTLPGLANFWMCGQWVEPGGGLPPAALSGRRTIQQLCAQDGRKFVTSVP